jgi:EAL domain-containing protein (putative c-di-GMP-specific phosphodiesterase class I)
MPTGRRRTSCASRASASRWTISAPASLSYRRSFPFDKIKIDRSFVSELSERPDCLAIIRAVTGLGTSLGIATTAEGVETSEQLARLRAEGCTEVQGYLFSPRDRRRKS